MSNTTACELPPSALLQHCRQQGAYVDCYTTVVKGPVSQAEFVQAFYTTPLFTLERLILRWALARPSTDAQARQLALGTTNAFAAWTVEARAVDQLLLADLSGRTKSWLMTAPDAGGTRLYFGSAVMPRKGAMAGRERYGGVFHALLGFHKLYSRLLLRAAAARLQGR